MRIGARRLAFVAVGRERRASVQRWNGLFRDDEIFVRLKLPETAPRQPFKGCCEEIAFSARLLLLRAYFRFRGIADMAGLAARSTR